MTQVHVEHIIISFVPGWGWLMAYHTDNRADIQCDIGGHIIIAALNIYMSETFVSG
jgi:hypothetical protein